MTKTYVFRTYWSQTDSELILVEATSQEKAEAWLRRNGDRGPRILQCYGEIERTFKVP